MKEKRNSEDVWVKHSSNDHGQKWALVKKAYLLGSCWSLECRNCASSVCVTRRCLTAVCCFSILIQAVGKLRTYLAFFKEETERHSRELMTQPYKARNPKMSQENLKSNFLRPIWQLKQTTADILTWNVHWLGHCQYLFLYGSVTVLSKTNPPWTSS